MSADREMLGRVALVLERSLEHHLDVEHEATCDRDDCAILIELRDWLGY